MESTMMHEGFSRPSMRERKSCIKVFQLGSLQEVGVEGNSNGNRVVPARIQRDGSGAGIQE